MRLFLLFAASFFILSPQTANAQESQPERVEFPVEIRDMKVDGNNAASDDVIHIETEPGGTHEIELELYSQSSHTTKLHITPAFAFTSPTGNTVYNGSERAPQESMEFPFTELAEIEADYVEIPANESEDVTFTVNAPDESFDGEILGSFHMLTFEYYGEGDEIVEPIVLTEDIRVRLTEVGNTAEIETNFEINGITPGLVTDSRPGARIDFTNPQPKEVQDINVEGNIYAEGESEPLYSESQEYNSIAPQSDFALNIGFEGELLEAGKYIYEGKIFEGSKVVEDFEEPFEITQADVTDTNTSEANVDESQAMPDTLLNRVIIIFIPLTVLAVSILVILIYLIRKRRKKNK